MDVKRIRIQVLFIRVWQWRTKKKKKTDGSQLDRCPLDKGQRERWLRRIMEKANKEGDTGEWALQDVMKDIDSKAEITTQSEIVPLH